MRKYTVPEISRTIGRDGISERKIKISIARIFNLSGKKRRSSRVYDSRRVATVPNFVGSYDGEAEEAGRTEV